MNYVIEMDMCIVCGCMIDPSLSMGAFCCVHSPVDKTGCRPYTNGDRKGYCRKCGRYLGC